MRWLLGAAALAATIGAAAAILGQAGSGDQPWTPELRDNVMLAQATPFLLGLGLALGVVAGAADRRRAERRRAERGADGAIRRFGSFAVAGHWAMAVGFLLALPTGVWQYMGGILDVHPPFPLYLLYRTHYVGAAIILVTAAAFLSYWWLSGDRSLLVPRGRWRQHLVGLAHELPRPLGARLAATLGLDLSDRPATEKFTFYETVFSFPSWTFVIALITVTGLVKAMRYVYPVPGEVLFWSSTLHVVAMGLIVVKILDHLRYTFERWPLVVAMVTGWVGEAYVRLRHPGWREAIEEGREG